ncbi:MAG: RNA polymerase sigma-70 factor [Flavobacteriaceae bacterium]|nr:RNA polymerase sigma-70 factor [Flavobacteriaceae bacterium]
MLKKIFYTHYSSLCNYSTAIVKDPMVAEDIVQNLFIQLWHTQKLEEISYIEPYLLRATKFKSIDYLRTKNYQKTIPLEECAIESDQKISELKEEDIEPLFLFFTSKLPPKTRTIFLKSREEDMTYKEIANELDLSIKTIEAHMAKALRQMRVMLKKHNLLSVLLLF